MVTQQANSPNPQQNTENLGARSIKGAMWLYASRYSGKILVFVTTIILARLLSQEEFGIAGYATIAMSFLEMLRGLGVSSALIYYPDDPKRINTGFWLILAVGSALFFIAYWCAPLAGLYFEDERAVAVVQVISLAFPINAFAMVHETLIRKSLDFKKLFAPELVRSIFKGLGSISLAYVGFGAFSLVYGHLIGAVATVVSLWMITKWRPKFEFSVEMAKPLLTYGLRIVSVQFQGTLLNNLDYLLIGRYLGAASLGVYTLAFKVPELTIKQFYILLGQVVFPTYSKLQDDLTKLRAGYLTTLRFISLVTVPIGIGLIMVVEPFVLIFLTERWIEAVSVIPQIAIFTLFKAIGPSSGAVYKAIGKPQILSRIKLFQLLISIPALYWAAAIVNSISIVGWTMAGLAFIEMLVNILVAIKVLDVKLNDILSQIMPAWAIGGGMAFILYLLQIWVEPLPLTIQLTLLILCGGFFYLGVVAMTIGLKPILNLFKDQPAKSNGLPTNRPLPSDFDYKIGSHVTHTDKKDQMNYVDHIKTKSTKTN